MDAAVLENIILSVVFYRQEGITMEYEDIVYRPPSEA